jgi:hypothetical protein
VTVYPLIRVRTRIAEIKQKTAQLNEERSSGALSIVQLMHQFLQFCGINGLDQMPCEASLGRPFTVLMLAVTGYSDQFAVAMLLE